MLKYLNTIPRYFILLISVALSIIKLNGLFDILDLSNLLKCGPQMLRIIAVHFLLANFNSDEIGWFLYTTFYIR